MSAAEFTAGRHLDAQGKAGAGPYPVKIHRRRLRAASSPGGSVPVRALHARSLVSLADSAAKRGACMHLLCSGNKAVACCHPGGLAACCTAKARCTAHTVQQIK